MSDLWPHQERAVNDIENAWFDGYRAVCYQLGTGGGKSRIIRTLVDHYSKSKNVIYCVAHRKNLVKQLSDELTEVGIRHGIIGSGAPFIKYRVQVCSINTLYRRVDRLPVPDLIIPDEAHHYTSKTFKTIFTSWPDALVCGFTATPGRPDGTALKDIFDYLICGPTNKELIQGGFLSPYHYFAPADLNMQDVHIRRGDYVQSEYIDRVDNKFIIGDAVENYRKYADHKPGITCCASIAHAEHVAKQFKEAGYKAYAIHSKLDDSKIENMIKGLKNGSIELLMQCNLLGEGINVPGATTLIDLAPTASVIKYLQDRGRVLRVANGKKNAIIIDHVGNYTRHGMPDDDRVWSLEGVPKGPREKSKYKRCPDCQQPVPVRARICENYIPPDYFDVCGHQWTETLGEGRMPEEKDGELVQINSVDWNRWNEVINKE